MRVRALDEYRDMQFGGGQSNFYRDQREGVGQCVETRMALYLGEWFLDTSDGTPWRTQVLGMRTEASRDPAMRARILGTPGVQSIAAYASQFDRVTRAYTVQADVDTVYGRVLVSTATSGPNQDVRQAR